jgi:hypothetical protein
MILSRITKYLIILLILSAVVVSACGPAATDNSNSVGGIVPDGANIDISLLPEYLRDHVEDYDRLAKSLKETDAAYAALAAFKWQGLDSLGFWEVQTRGAACLTYDRIYEKNEPSGLFSTDAKWIALNTMIPSPERVKTISISLNACNNTAAKINPRTYYSQLNLSGADDDQKNKQDWLALCKGLDSSLKSALYMAATMDKTSNFADVTASFKTASNGTRDKYFSKFQDQSKQFSTLLAVLIAKLTAAEAAAAKLASTDTVQ